MPPDADELAPPTAMPSVHVYRSEQTHWCFGALQALAERQEDEAREQQLRAQQNKQQLALHHAALAAARAEAQANAEVQAQEDAIQVEPTWTLTWSICTFYAHASLHAYVAPQLLDTSLAIQLQQSQKETYNLAHCHC